MRIALVGGKGRVEKCVDCIISIPVSYVREGMTPMSKIVLCGYTSIALKLTDLKIMMLIDPNEMKKLDAGLKVILVIWGAILASLGVYLVVCIYLQESLHINTAPDLPLDTLKYALLGVSCVTLCVVPFLRKSMMRPNKPAAKAGFATSIQHPAIGKYTVVTVVTLAMLESIGIYGVVLFLLSKDTMTLYLFLMISAGSMIYFRPRKEELVNIAEQMDNQGRR